VLNQEEFNMVHRKKSQPKKSVPVPLFIVEGFTEKNYIDILKGIYSENVVVKNCFGGGANTVLLKSDKILSDSEEISYYTSFVIIYDLDTDSPRYDVLRKKVETYPNVKLLILDPCFENWLLLHIRNNSIKGTMNCSKCISALKKHIPNYEKDDFKLLQKYVTKDTFSRACSSQPIIGKVLKEYFKDKIA
jgi:hypothetical protein